MLFCQGTMAFPTKISSTILQNTLHPALLFTMLHFFKVMMFLTIRVQVTLPRSNSRYMYHVLYLGTNSV